MEGAVNYELVPCCIKGCEGTGKFAVAVSYGTIQMCAAHALKVMELSKKQGRSFVRVEDDDAD